ncbi:MAG: PspA/IM30 family protein [Deltaproteobacteria bacterium]|nr:PspA/IM30 family protein [Deltaproteobacteria bacterium]
MGIFARLADLIKSNLNDMISRAEDPEKMLNQVIIEMANQLIEAKKGVAEAIAMEKKLLKQAEEEAAKVTEWERRAMMAVRAGDDALAKEALNRKKEHQSHAETLKAQWAKQKAQVDQIKLALRALNGKIEEAKRKKQVLIARKRQAEARKKIQETMAGLQNASAFETFQRMEDRILQMEGEADAAGELAEEYSGDTLAQKFKTLEQTSGSDEELLDLKRKMGVAPSAPPPAEAPAAVRVEQTAAEDFSQLSQDEQEQLSQALAELEAQEAAAQARMKR